MEIDRDKKVKLIKETLRLAEAKYNKRKAELEENIKTELARYKIGDIVNSTESSRSLKIERIKVDSYGDKFSIKYWGRTVKANGELGQREDFHWERY